MSEQLTPASVVVLVPAQVSADLDGETVVLGLDSGTYYGLVGIGSRIWELIRQPRTVAELCDVIVAEYEVAPQTCERDLMSFLDRLASEQLIEVKGELPESVPPTSAV
jgi:hypothetical protein